MTENQFWWVRVRHEDGTPGKLQLVEVEFEGSSPRQANFMNTCATLMPEDIDTLTLVERVLPAGRRDALVACGWLKSGYVGALQGCEVTGEDGEPTGEANTLIDGYFDLKKGAAILQGGDA